MQAFLRYTHPSHGVWNLLPRRIERLKESYWNIYESQVFTPPAFGIGWAINLYALLENLRVIKEPDVSEESFLMPSSAMKEAMKGLLQTPQETD